MPCRIKIQHVPKMGREEFGESFEYSDEATKKTLVMGIKMSKNRNRRFSVYFRTLVHELMHVAFRIVQRVCKRKYTPESEHEFIERIEDTMLLHLKVLKKVKE